MYRRSFAKGHGTKNDFVIMVDREGLLGLEAGEVRAICDRRSGIGADGVLRAVTGRFVPEWQGDPEIWFMDYRNADGSIAQMCGNGVRVFVRYLLEEGLASGPVVPVGTRAGLRTAELLEDGRIRVAMGPVIIDQPGVVVRPRGAEELPAYRVDVGNPHAVCFVSDLERLDLASAPRWSPPEAYPEGVNVEFVRTDSPSRITMRVFERGVGETMSCGTGTVAAAAAAARRLGIEGPAVFEVAVPGGEVEVELAAGMSYLSGPAVIVARGELTFSLEGQLETPAS